MREYDSCRHRLVQWANRDLGLYRVVPARATKGQCLPIVNESGKQSLAEGGRHSLTMGMNAD